MWFGAQLYKEGLLDDPPMFQMCLGIPWGAPATPLAMQAMKDIMPKEGVWSGFAISEMKCLLLHKLRSWEEIQE